MLANPQGEVALTTLSAAVGPFNTTVTTVITYTLPANFFKAGTTVKVTIAGSCTATAAVGSTINVDVGGVLINAGAVTSGTSGSATPFVFECWITARGSGTSVVLASYSTLVFAGGIGGASPGVSSFMGSFGAFGSINTTISNVILSNWSTGASTCNITVDQGMIEVIKP